jgi:RNA polymerase sigma-70 factor (ECF subfamily)
MPPDALQLFERERRRLFAIAYRMLGTVADAEDVLQDAWRRWSAVDPATVESPSAYLARTVTRLALDLLGAAHRRRIEYVGPWLPEPVVEPWSGGRAPAELDALADSLSTAFLVLLERLSPVERAVFVLRECFDFSYRDIAPVVGKSEANCRQIDRRARQRIAEPRTTRRADPKEHARVVERFLQATQAGDLDGLLALLAEDARSESDGGGVVIAARRAVEGAGNVARFIIGLRSKAPPDWTMEPVLVNGRLGLLGRIGGQPNSVVSFEVVEGKVRQVFIQVNPAKLRAAAITAPDESR